ncbi:uncharacterized protein FTJAE_12487 [Fusarium tjaetaba]|uniref:Uncharacterized protein n=1 Tax=Fusarium tjaetaba TaxID=1567544 RepID=A0A8H5QP17_9HYPO|nr:uncharacterized protein FTJAE_12487 [Fusarium tjaetaba]KAF5617828.1 hypothetical protein FTJAE_12487 [Fusarium tjaetaba]
MATGPRTYRYQFALCTGNDDSEYYDQTTALSQALINRSFRHLFENTEGVAGIDHFDDAAGDRIFGVLDAPTLMLIGHTVDESLAYYQLRIKEANVVFRNGQTRTLSQWALTVKVNLSEVSLEIQPSEDEETRKNKEYWKQDIARRYPGLEVGDYRAQRIFANFSAAQWKKPIEERSTCFDQKAKKTIALQEWKDQAENSGYFYRIMDLIDGWAKTQAHEGLSTLGIKFSLYQDPDEIKRPTFKPMLQHIQVYPYKSQKCPNGTTAIRDPSKITQEAPFGDLVHGDFNCLMFCENVDTSWNVPGKSTNSIFRSLPQKKHMSHSYNMACPVSDDDPKLPDLLGTFAMDYRVVMHRYLLPALEDLCLATVVKIEEPERTIAVPDIAFNPRYTIGCPRTERELNSSPDTDIKFTKLSDRHYQWIVRDSKGETGHRFTDGPYSYHRDRYNSYQIDTESKVEVEWATGQSAMVISASVSYNYNCAFANNKEMTDQVDSVKYNVIAKSFFSLGLQPVDLDYLVILPQIKGLSREDAQNIKYGANKSPSDLPAVSDGDLKITSFPVCITATGKGRDDSEFRLKTDLEKSLRIGIERFTSRVDEHFRWGRGKLIFPGHGNLLLMNPKFTKFGGIVADVGLRRNEPNGTMSFPKPGPSPPSGDKGPGPQKPSPDVPKRKEENDLKLSWDHQVSYNPQSKIGRLSLRALNSKKEDLSFHFIRISLLTSTSTHTRPFDDTEWSKAPDAKALDVLFSHGKYTYVDSDSKDPPLEVELQGNVYQLNKSKGWSTNVPALEVKLNRDRNAREMQASIQGLKGTDFKVPKGQEFTLELQGEIQELGRYMIKISESWKKVPGLKFGGEGMAISHKDIDIQP